MNKTSAIVFLILSINAQSNEEVIENEQQSETDLSNYQTQVSSCELCYNSYLSEGQCKVVEDHVDYCQQYNDQSECQVCNSGFYLKDKSCHKIDLYKCIKLKDDNNQEICEVCDKDILVDQDGKCDKDNECEIDHCDYCGRDNNDKAVCQLCGHNYSLYKGQVNEPWRCLCNDNYIDTDEERSFESQEENKDSQEETALNKNFIKTLEGCQYRVIGDSRKCYFCLSGYNMTKQGRCEYNHYQDVDLGSGVYRVCALIFALIMI